MLLLPCLSGTALSNRPDQEARADVLSYVATPAADGVASDSRLDRAVRHSIDGLEESR
jgi:hypothetical protein